MTDSNGSQQLRFGLLSLRDIQHHAEHTTLLMDCHRVRRKQIVA